MINPIILERRKLTGLELSAFPDTTSAERWVEVGVFFHQGIFSV